MMQRSRTSAHLVALIALFTGSLAAQSDRLRQRSGPIRSVPVAADIKRDDNFDCPEEFGYYPHPNDCTQYYVCVFGGALLESCTGGLMYSHELQTCDWPRNVGCDATNSGAERPIDVERGIDVERLRERESDIERLNEREPLPPRRNPPPPPQRAQPNPVVTSRGQPKITREEYVQQQQLYEEVDDLPPVEEIESDRQQRVYRGQPSTIGQVQRDRDGYSQNNPGRNLNTNIIPASITQGNGKIGSFSFGTQVDERRTATVTQRPQTYRMNENNVTDNQSDRQIDIMTNEITDHDLEHKKSRNKREAVDGVKLNTNLTKSDIDSISARSDFDADDIERDLDLLFDEDSIDDNERDKRQIRQGRYYLKNGYKNSGNKDYFPNNHYEISQLNFNTGLKSNENLRHHPTYNSIAYQDASSKPTLTNNFFSTPNPYLHFTNDGNVLPYETEPALNKPFKPSLRDPYSLRPPHNPLNSATHIITKSPPISLLSNNENPFAALAGGFFNNAPKYSTIHQHANQLNNNNILHKYHDSSQLSTSLVTDKPVLLLTSPHVKNENNFNKHSNNNVDSLQNHDKKPERNQVLNDDVKESSENNEDGAEEDLNSTEHSDEDNNNDEFYHYKHDFPDPPYEFTHPNHKYAEIRNPFADPNFDFDSFLDNLRGEHLPVTDLRNKKNNNLQTFNPHLNHYSNSDNDKHKNILKGTTLSYNGMSTPRPFTLPAESFGALQENKYISHSSTSGIPNTANFGRIAQRPSNSENQNGLRPPNISEITDGDVRRPKLKPPNFKDDRQLPINHNFNENLGYYNYTSQKPNIKGTDKLNIPLSTVTPKTIVYLTSKNPQLFSVGKPHFRNLQNNGQENGKIARRPYFYSTISPHNNNFIKIQSSPKPILFKQQLPIPIHQYRLQPTQGTPQNKNNSIKISEIPSLESIFSEKYKHADQVNPNNSKPVSILRETATHPPTRKKPIPKPSPEMNDYYYDEDDEQYYYEPAVKPKYMPSSEVRPQRPPMAQNYEEYDDLSYEDDDELSTPNKSENSFSNKKPSEYNTYKVESATRNINDVSIATKPTIKNNNPKGKIPVPVIMDFVTPSSVILKRPNVTNYQIVHSHKNRTVYLRKPNKRIKEFGPNTIQPPKYLNQTTLRPYTVRHRLAKPTTMKPTSTSNIDSKQVNGRLRNINTKTRMKLTTPNDNHNQETRYTKTRHDDRTNSLEPTESITPVSYSASPRPKMLYNGSQSYSPDQFDSYYVYDEDGQLYKDADYVQQYNSASLRPAVQQTYRGTPPPVRRPVETYSPRPVSDVEYDDALIQGQINNQNQYQTAIRQSTRGDGNELGYDNNPSSVRTTIFEATSISTTPSTTTSTSTTTTTTTQRPTTAPFTEATIPSRHTPRSSTNENHNAITTSKIPTLSLSFDTSIPTNTVFNFSYLAKPFEKTNNSLNYRQTLLNSEKLSRPNLINDSQVNNNTKNKIVSLTTGFSIRRNINNSNNPYTLTVITRPIDNVNVSLKALADQNNGNDYFKNIHTRNKDLSNTYRKNNEPNKPTPNSIRRTDSNKEYYDEEAPILLSFLQPIATEKTKIHEETKKTHKKITASIENTIGPKYYLKTVIKRPAPFTVNEEKLAQPAYGVETETLIEKGLDNIRKQNEEKPSNDHPDSVIQSNAWDHPPISTYKSLNNLNKSYKDVTMATPSVLEYVPAATKKYINYNIPAENKILTTPISTKLEPDNYNNEKSSEVFSNSAKQVLRAFFNNYLYSTQKPEIIKTTPRHDLTTTEKIVNIGYQNRFIKYDDQSATPKGIKHLEIITESIPRSITTDSSTSSNIQEVLNEQKASPSTEATKIWIKNGRTKENNYIESKDDENKSNENVSLSKFETMLSQSILPTSENTAEEFKTEPPLLNKIADLSRNITNIQKQDYDKDSSNVIPSAKSTIQTTVQKTSTKNYSPFPTRSTRVNPAIKLAASNLGGGRRSYQSSSKCSSDDSLQANPKCNEIKYQRPSSTRGRGSAHYSTLGGGDAPINPQPANRGTPPTRSRPTLKPSTVIVSKATEFVDIYTNPPSRPPPVYPQPTPDKTAAKCRKDVCLLPDCSCGGKDIPGDLPVESVPQIVLLTFDDSVNDLNKVLYADLFEKGRVNPNGCPISATFYVSHEWTDYSQVQNLYSAGHEMASHTISFGEQFSQKKWNKEVGGQREVLAAYGGVKADDVRGMRAPFLSVGGNKMFKMLYDSNFTYDSSMPVYENRPPSWPYTLDYKLFHDCMIPPCPTKSYPGVWEVPMVMWQDLNGGRCSMGDACANPPAADGVYKMLLKNFDRHYTTNRAPFGLFYHAAWFTQPHHKAGFIMFLDFINQMQDVWVVTNWQALQWVRDPTPISRINTFQPFQCNYQDRPKKCNHPKVCNLWHKSGVRYMRTCQPCPEIYPWTGKTGIRSSRIDNEIEE